MTLSITTLGTLSTEPCQDSSTIFFVPSTIADVVVARIWQWIYHPFYGINAVLMSRPLSFLALGWLYRPQPLHQERGDPMSTQTIVRGSMACRHGPGRPHHRPLRRHGRIPMASLKRP